MKIAIAGANGRMGHILIEAVLKADDAILTGALDVANASGLGNDAGLFLGEKTGVSVESDMDKAFGNAEYVIDFTLTGRDPRTSCLLCRKTHQNDHRHNRIR